MPAWMTKEGVPAQPAHVAPPALGGLNGERADGHDAGVLFVAMGFYAARNPRSSVSLSLSHSLTVRSRLAVTLHGVGYLPLCRSAPRPMDPCLSVGVG